MCKRWKPIANTGCWLDSRSHQYSFPYPNTLSSRSNFSGQASSSSGPRCFWDVKMFNLRLSLDLYAYLRKTRWSNFRASLAITKRIRSFPSIDRDTMNPARGWKQGYPVEQLIERIICERVGCKYGNSGKCPRDTRGQDQRKIHLPSSRSTYFKSRWNRV